MIGVIVNVLAVALGGVLGTVFSKKLSTRFTTELNKVFGVCAIGMGISSVPLMQNMPAVILAVVAGTALGLACHLGEWSCMHHIHSEHLPSASSSARETGTTRTAFRARNTSRFW